VAKEDVCLKRGIILKFELHLKSRLPIVVDLDRK
jgi:hypothetical protein